MMQQRWSYAGRRRVKTGGEKGGCKGGGAGGEGRIVVVVVVVNGDVNGNGGRWRPWTAIVVPLAGGRWRWRWLLEGVGNIIENINLQHLLIKNSPTSSNPPTSDPRRVQRRRRQRP